MKKLLFLLLIALPFCGFSQTIKQLYPSQIRPLEFGPGHEKAFNEHMDQCKTIWAKLSAGTEYNQLPEAEQKFLDSCDELSGDYWDVIDQGPSWYDAGGPYRVTASSELASQGSNNYSASNAHDFDYRNA